MVFAPHTRQTDSIVPLARRTRRPAQADAGLGRRRRRSVRTAPARGTWHTPAVSGPALAVEDQQHAAIAPQQRHEALGVQAGARVVAAPVDHLERRPAGALVGPRRRDQRAPLQQLERRRRRDDDARHAGARARSAATTHTFHVGARSEAWRSSWPSSTTIAANPGTGDTPRRACRSRLRRRRRAPHSVGTTAATPPARRSRCGQLRRVGRRRHDTSAGPAAQRGLDDRKRSAPGGSRRTAGRGQRLFGERVGYGRGRTRRAVARAALRWRPAATPSAGSRAPPGPPPGRPPASSISSDGGPQPVTLAIGWSRTPSGGVTSSAVTQPRRGARATGRARWCRPSPPAPACRERVVELAVERGTVDENADDQHRYRDRALFKLSRRLSSSHVNSFSERPKWP